MTWRSGPMRAFSRSAGRPNTCQLSKYRHALAYAQSHRPLLSSAGADALATRADAPSIATLLGRPAAELEGRDITVTGNVRTVRVQKQHAFVKLGDGSTTAELQALLNPSHAEGLATGAAVAISGRWTRSPGAEQPFELVASRVHVVGGVDAERYPLQKKYHSPEFLRSLPHLRLRRTFQGLLARLRSDVDFYAADVFRRRDYVRVAPPVITSSDCEGAGEVFTLGPRGASPDEAASFFKESKYLTVSAQLHLEAFAAEHRRVWALGPTFRAERSDTPRHLSEFAMLEAELQTAELDDVMAVVEGLVRDVTMHVKASRTGDEVLAPVKHGGDAQIARTAQVRRRWEGLCRDPWPRITYSRALSRLEDAAASGQTSFSTSPAWGSGLHIEHERYIASAVGQGSPVFVTEYPRAIKPFYMLESLDGFEGERRATAACFDLLLPDVGEVAGGSLREHRLEPLLAAMRRAGLFADDQDDGRKPALDWYLDLRRYGSVPHGGFGLGLDRLLGYLAGMDNVRDVVPWPRYFGRCDG